MKKTASIVITILMMIVLAACQFGEENERTFFIEETEGATATETFTYKGDTLIKQVGVYETDYELFGLANKEEAVSFFEEFIEERPDFDMIEYEVEYFDDYVIETLTIDIESLTPEAYEYLYEDTITSREVKKLSMKETAKNMLNEGFVEITEENKNNH